VAALLLTLVALRRLKIKAGHSRANVSNALLTAAAMHRGLRDLDLEIGYTYQSQALHATLSTPENWSQLEVGEGRVRLAHTYGLGRR
jgi:hypothetical protein